MKKGLIFATTLALALSVGVAVGAHQTKAARVEALSGGDTVYLDPGVWDTDNAWYAVYTYGSAENWVKMDKVAGENIYSATLNSSNNTMIFCRMNKNDTTTMSWSNKWNQSNDLTYASATGNLYSITGWGSEKSPGEWSTYSKITVTVYVNGAKRGDEQVTSGSLPVAPTAVYGEAFSGWFDDADCTAGHEVTAITAATTVYGKTSVVPEVTFSVDATRVSWANPYFYAWVWETNYSDGRWVELTTSATKANKLEMTIHSYETHIKFARCSYIPTSHDASEFDTYKVCNYRETTVKGDGYCYSITDWNSGEWSSNAI